MLLGKNLNVRILVVDSDPEICRFLERALGRILPGHTLAWTDDAKKGLVGFCHTEPHLVFVAQGLPDGEGIALCRLMTAHWRRVEPRLVCLSDWVTPGLRVRAERAGCAAVLAKPFSVGELRALLTRVLGSRAVLRRPLSAPFPKQL